MSVRKYCDDTNCPNFLNGEDCKLGFELEFRTPKSISEAVYSDWGYLMPKVCRKNKPYERFSLITKHSNGNSRR